MKKINVVIFLMLNALFSSAQLSIVNTNLNSLNVTPQSLCQVNILNGTTGEVQVVLEAKLLNSSGESILSVKTNPFMLAVGMNNGMQLNYSIQSSLFSSSAQSQFIQTTHTLPSGNFKYCISILSLTDEGRDDYCEDILSDVISFLNLVYPYDKDTIDSSYPLLTWTHSEPFNILSSGEYFRMILVELNKEQSAESGVISNTPIYYKNYLTSHQQPYPVDAKNLESGKRYGWQVQKLSNGTIIDKSEAWEFILSKKSDPSFNKYAVLKKKLDAGFYTVESQRLFFKFNESYISGEVICKIIDDNGKEIKPILKNEINKDEKLENTNVKINGVNLFEIDLKPYQIKTGYYELEVLNSKGEKYKLKFYVN